MIHIVCGIPGSGKTLVTRYLAEKLGGEVINTGEALNALAKRVMNINDKKRKYGL